MSDLNQDRLYALLDAYNGGTEPLQNWDTQDLVTLQLIVDAELQRRAELAGQPTYPHDADQEYQRDYNPFA